MDPVNVILLYDGIIIIDALTRKLCFHVVVGQGGANSNRLVSLIYQNKSYFYKMITCFVGKIYV